MFGSHFLHFPLGFEFWQSLLLFFAYSLFFGGCSYSFGYNNLYRLRSSYFESFFALGSFQWLRYANMEVFDIIAKACTQTKNSEAKRSNSLRKYSSSWAVG